MKVKIINNQSRLLFGNEELDNSQSTHGAVKGIRCYTNIVAIFFLTLFGRAIYDYENKVYMSVYSFKNWLKQHKKNVIIKNVDFTKSIPFILQACKRKLEEAEKYKGILKSNKVEISNYLENTTKNVAYSYNIKKLYEFANKDKRNELDEIMRSELKNGLHAHLFTKKFFVDIFSRLYENSTKEEKNDLFNALIREANANFAQIINYLNDDHPKILIDSAISSQSNNNKIFNQQRGLYFLENYNKNIVDYKKAEVEKIIKKESVMTDSQEEIKSTSKEVNKKAINAIKKYARPYSELNKNDSQVSRLFLKYLEIFDCQNKLQSFIFDENTGRFALQLKHQSKYWYQPKKEIKRLQKGLILEFGDINGNVSGTYDKINNKIIFTKGFSAFTEYTTGLPWPLPKTIDANATLNEIGLNENDNSKFSATSTPQTPLSMFNKPLSKKVSIHQFFEELKTGKKVEISNKEFFKNL